MKKQDVNFELSGRDILITEFVSTTISYRRVFKTIAPSDIHTHLDPEVEDTIIDVAKKILRSHPYFCSKTWFFHNQKIA